MIHNRSVLQRFLLGFEGTSPPKDLGALLRGGLAGVAVFRRNWTALEGLRALTKQIQEAAGRPVIIGMDQEGGKKFALPEPFTQWPSAADLGLLNDAAAVEQVARAMARELRAVGCNLNFAPMLDLHINPQSPVTQERSFGADPQRVGPLGAAFLRGLASEGVLGCAKHFPGHGDAAVDPHEDLPVFHGDMALLEQRELVPFAAAIAAGAPMVMTAHILLPKIDPAQPASLSRTLLHDTLRRKMQFEGVILADDMGMGAIRKRFPAVPGEKGGATRGGLGAAAVAAIEAGADMVMLAHDWAAVRPAMDAVQRTYESYRFDDIEWEASRLRIEKLLGACSSGAAVGVATPGTKVLGCKEHQEVAEKLSERIREIKSSFPASPASKGRLGV